MKLAFWNVISGGTSFDPKLQVITDWIDATKPDVLILEELGWDFIKQEPKFLPEHYSLIGASSQQVRTTDKNDDRTPKCIAGFQSDSFARIHTIRSVPPNTLAGLKQKRNILQLRVTTPSLDIYGIHANASGAGGTAAIEHTWEFLKELSNPPKTVTTAKNARTVVGGDFNLDIKEAKVFFTAQIAALSVLAPGGAGGFWPGLPVSPKSRLGVDLEFTQWGNNHGVNKPDAADLLLDQKVFNEHATKLSQVERHGVIDYITHSAAVKVTAVPNVPMGPAHVELWGRILTHFDHCPVVYEVT